MKLEISNLNKSFKDNHVLKDLTFSFNSGESLALLGRNGAGKTTLFRCILKIIEQDTGKILLDGNEIDRSKISIGYLPEERGLYMKKTVYEQMKYFGKLHGLSKNACDKTIDYLLEKLEATQYKNKKLDTLSKGNQQKIQLAISLISNPDVIILDEPFSGLDPVSSMILKNLIKDFANNNKLVIFSSHEMSYTEEFCQNIAILHNGVIKLTGNLDEIKESYPKNNVKVSLTNKDNYVLIKENPSFTEICTNINFDDTYITFNLVDETKVSELQKLLVTSNYFTEQFTIVKPTLEEIFIETVGE